MRFLYRLALGLGEWNVECSGGLADVIPPEQVDRWMEFYALEPWGCVADDTRAGKIGLTTVVMQAGKDCELTEASFHAGTWSKRDEE